MALNQRADPLPGQGDLQVRDRVLGMQSANPPVFTRRPGVDRNGKARPPWTDVLGLALGGARAGRVVAGWRGPSPEPRILGFQGHGF